MPVQMRVLVGILLISCLAAEAADKRRRPRFRHIRGEAQNQSTKTTAQPESLYTTKAGATGSATASDRPTPVSDEELIESFDPRSRPKGSTAEAPLPEETADPTRYFEDLPGTTVAGIPRVIRDNAGTEIFFSNLNQSYVIAQDNLHNRKFKIFADAMKTGANVSFKADPISRRILEVDGVDQASAAPKPKKLPASIPSQPTSGGKAGEK